MTRRLSDFEIDDFTLAAAKRGDLRACETVYRRFQRPAFNVAVRVVHCREMAQEITQEAFITAFRRLKQYRGDAPFWAWLKRVVVNHAISALRRAPSAEVVTFEDHLASMDGEQERIGHAMDLEDALARLGPEDRAVVWLHDVEGYRHREIAELFGKTESFSKTRLARARARLRELIAATEAVARAE